MKCVITQLIDAINNLGTPTFFDWMPIVLSVVTAATAIYIPVRIAKKQNQIAIFDKLYTAYVQLLLVKNFAGVIQGCCFTGDSTDVMKSCELFSVHFEKDFGYKPDIFNGQNSIGTATAALSKNETQAYMIPLLISEDTIQKKECSEHIEKIYGSLYLLTTNVVLFNWEFAEETNELLKEFTANINSFFDLYADKIEDALLCARKA